MPTNIVSDEKIEHFFDLLMTSALPLEAKEQIAALFDQDRITQEEFENLYRLLQEADQDQEAFLKLAIELANELENKQLQIEQEQKDITDQFVEDVLAEKA